MAVCGSVAVCVAVCAWHCSCRLCSGDTVLVMLRAGVCLGVCVCLHACVRGCECRNPLWSRWHGGTSAGVGEAGVADIT